MVCQTDLQLTFPQGILELEATRSMKNLIHCYTSLTREQFLFLSCFHSES